MPDMRKTNDPGSAGMVSGLIEDRALQGVGDDQLGHDQIAEHLAQIALGVQPPANVALYGRWGSGKTSVANFVRAEVDRHQAAEWVYFDAFKWSGAALKRHLLTQVAKTLPGHGFDPKALYTDRTADRYELDWATLRTTVFSAAVLLGVVGLILAGAVGLTALIDRWVHGAWAEQLTSTVVASAALFSVLGITLKTLLTGSLDSFKVTTSRAAPSGEEQFEKTFCELVEPTTRAGGRVVMFIDELDRCSATEVVETLEAVRTFLDVPGCVCIVAADKHVLEHALSRAVRQETPADRTNPYYTSGSAYLEKVFAYQVMLPPALPRRLTKLAVELVGDAGGAWNDVEDPERVVSVLIPTHVRSMRRVKALLNAYAIAHRTLVHRCREGVVRGPVADRETELAKWVCLQLEFPLFARELSTTPELTEQILEVAPASTSRRGRARALAQEFVGHTRPVEVDLSDPAHDDAPDPESGQADSGQEQPPAGATASSVVAGGEPVSFADQLVSYLRKTEPITGPRGDLIHMESVGSFVDLDPALAERLENLAVDRNVAELRAELDELDRSTRISALRMLATQLREAVELDADNLATSLLALVSQMEPGELDEVADSIVDRVAADLDRRELAPDDLHGAYLLGVTSSRSSARRLVAGAMTSPAVETTELGMAVAQTIDRLDQQHVVESGRALAHRLVDSATVEPVAELLKQHPPATARAALHAARTSILDLLRPPDPAATDEEDLPAGESDLVEQRVEALAQACHLLASQTDLVQPLFLAMVGAKPAVARDVGVRLLRGGLDLGIAEPEPARQLLTAMNRRRPADWHPWLAANAAEPLQADDAAASVLRRSVVKLWDALHEASDETARRLDSTAKELARFIKDAKLDRTDVGRLPDQLADANELQPGEHALAARRLGRARDWVRLGLLTEAAVADAHVDVILAWLSATPDPRVANSAAALQSDLAAAAPAMTEWVRWVSQRDAQHAQSIAAALDGSSAAVPSPYVEEMALTAHAAAGDTDGEALGIGAEAISDLLQAHGDGACGAANAWLVTYAANSTAVLDSLDGVLHKRRIIDRVRDGIESFWRRADESQRVQLLQSYLRDDSIHIRFLECLDPQPISDTAVADALSSAFDRASNNDERGRILEVWGWLGPEDDRARRTLIQDVYIPMCTLNKGAAQLAVRHAEDLVQDPPHGTKTQLRDAAAEAVGRVDDRKRARKAFEAAGLRVRSSGLARVIEELTDGF